MLKLKNIISVLLLLTYFSSVAHSFVPHHQHTSEVEHHHHDNDHEHDVEHDHHISHENHFDESFIDYIACLFGEHNHSKDEITKVVEKHERVKTNKTDFNYLNSLAVENNTVFCSIIEQELNYHYQSSRLLKQDILSYPQRGPPFI